MPVGSLQDADQHSVAVSLLINNRRAVLRGHATYHARSEFGPCLMIAMKDAAGDFEMVLQGEDWLASMNPGSELGTDFYIVLESPGEKYS